MEVNAFKGRMAYEELGNSRGGIAAVDAMGFGNDSAAITYIYGSRMTEKATHTSDRCGVGIQRGLEAHLQCFVMSGCGGQDVKQALRL